MDKPIPLGIIPASPGQTIVRIWVDTDDMTPIVEHWPVIAWRVMDGWAEPVCTHAKSFDDQTELFVQPDGKLADLDGDEVFETLEKAVSALMLEARKPGAA